MFPSKTIHTDGLRAGLLTSFGFGQVGGAALVLHPRYLFGVLTPEQIASYKTQNQARALQSYKAMSEMMIKNSLVKVKNHPPYTEELEAPPSKSGGHLFPAKLVTKYTPDRRNAEVLTKSLSSATTNMGFGVDQG